MENLAIGARKKITMDKYFSSVKVVVTNNIKDVVSVNARADILSNEITNGFMVLTGKIYVDLVYISDENNIESSSNIIDFVERQKFGLTLLDVSVADYVSVEKFSFSGSEVVCEIMHKTEVFGIQKYLVGKFSETEKDFVLNKKNIECTSFVSAGEDRFVVAEEVESNLGNVTILSNSAKLVISEISAGANKVVIDGKVVISSLYKDDEGTGECQKDIEFRQEIEAKMASPSMRADALLRVTNVSVVPDKKNEKTVMSYVVDIYAKAYLFEETIAETYDDIFSLKNEIVPTYDFVELSCDDGYKYDSDMIMMQTDISGLEDFDDIVGVYMPKFENVEFEDNGEMVLINSKISAVGLYRTSRGIEKLALSYDVKFETDKDISKLVSKVIPTIAVSSFKVKAGKDLEVSFSLGYKILYEKTSLEKYVKSFELKQEKNKDDSAVKVYILKENKSLFEVAKALNVRPEIIAQQNEVDDVFEAGQKIYIYSPLNI